jgi:CHASE3 domain sensor protein
MIVRRPLHEPYEQANSQTARRISEISAYTLNSQTARRISEISAYTLNSLEQA